MTESSHFYDPRTAEPRHFIPKKDGSGNRPSTIADCRKNGWVPSPTTILKLLDKPALREWMVKQAVHAVVTAPDVPGEGLDAKIDRILNQERQQDEESRIAADRGTQIHEALAGFATAHIEGKPYPLSIVTSDIGPWVEPAWQHILAIGTPIASEIVLVGDGYAGRTDLIIRCENGMECVVDYKTTGKLPEKGAWPEAKIQLAAYAHARNGARIPDTANLYISTKEPGRFVWCDNSATLERDYAMFRHLLEYWRIANNMDQIQEVIP